MNLYESKNLKYSDIFNKRGLEYHKAMVMLPNSRDNEFLNITKQVKFSLDMIVVDVPSGGNYLKNFLPKSINYIPLETSSSFADINNTKICDWSQLPFENSSIDVIIVCAAFHHVSNEDRLKFKEEAIRVLKSNGKLVIADVQKGSKIDNFLNGFVNEQNSMGHNGEFLETNFCIEYETKKLIAEKDVVIDFPWVLSSETEESMKYVQLLFGLDKANTEQIEKYLTKNLNLTKNNNNKLQIDWQLRYVTFQKI